jgi:excisionase family DNA binding protein
MDYPIFVGKDVWCPLCEEYTQLIRVQKAANLADVSQRTIYRYIEEGSIYSVKIAGKTYRVCSRCLLSHDDFSEGGGGHVKKIVPKCDIWYCFEFII